MRRVFRTCSLLLFSAFYLHVATAMLIESRTVPAAGCGSHAVTASGGMSKVAHKPLWLQRRHLLLRSPLIVVDASCILVVNPAPLSIPRGVFAPPGSSGDYHSFRSSLLANKAPPAA